MTNFLGQVFSLMRKYPFSSVLEPRRRPKVKKALPIPETANITLTSEKQIISSYKQVGYFFVATVNPPYTDTRYNEIIRYNDNSDWHETFAQEVAVNQKLCKNIWFNTSRNICSEYLFESPHWGDSNKYPKHMFCEVRIKQGLSSISFCSLRSLNNSKFILMATSLSTNYVAVTRVHRTSMNAQGNPLC